MAGSAVTKTLVDVDDDLFAKAQAALGTNTKKETVNEALRESLQMSAIQEFLQATGTHERTSPGLVLADASALVHCREPTVAARLLPLLVLDDLATCAAVQYELSSLGDEAGPLAALRQIQLRWLPTDDVDLRRAADVQAELTRQEPLTLPWQRLVTAVVAARYSATVVHYTSDYDLIARVTGQDTEWIALPGTLPERPPEGLSGFSERPGSPVMANQFVGGMVPATSRPWPRDER